MASWDCINKLYYSDFTLHYDVCGFMFIMFTVHHYTYSVILFTAKQIVGGEGMWLF